MVCQEYWRLTKVWEPRYDDWTPHRVVGSAIHAGVARYLQSRIGNETVKSTSPEPRLEPLAVAQRVLGEGFHEQDTWDLAGLRRLVGRGLGLLIEEIETRLLPGAQICAIEYHHPDDVPPHRILDCVLERHGALEVIDWKVSLRLDQSYFGGRQREALHDWQLLDYAWHTREWFQRKVAAAMQVVAVLGPKMDVMWAPTIVDDTRLDQWHYHALQVWEQMHSGKTWANFGVCDDRHLFYGQSCPMWTGCHELKGDETRFAGVYRKKGQSGLLNPDEG